MECLPEPNIEDKYKMVSQEKDPLLPKVRFLDKSMNMLNSLMKAAKMHITDSIAFITQ